MKFKYVGEEATEWFGHKWATGTVHDVTDTHAIAKLSNSSLFEAAGSSAPAPVEPAHLSVSDEFDELPDEEPVAEPIPKKKGGRQRKEVVTDDDAQPD